MNLSYFPGEVNLRRADVIVINKVDTAEQRDIETVRQNIKLHNPKGGSFGDGLQSLRGRAVSWSRDGAYWWWRTALHSLTVKCLTAPV